MSDPADLAGTVEQHERENSLARQAARNTEREMPFEIDGVRVCLDCYELISTARLAAKPEAVRCVECQNDNDRRRRKHGIA